MKQVVSLEMEPFNEVTKLCRPPRLRRCFKAIGLLHLISVPPPPCRGPLFSLF